MEKYEIGPLGFNDDKIANGFIMVGYNYLIAYAENNKIREVLVARRDGSGKLENCFIRENVDV